MAGPGVQFGDMMDTRSETWLTLQFVVRPISPIRCAEANAVSTGCAPGTLQPRGKFDDRDKLGNYTAIVQRWGWHKMTGWKTTREAIAADRQRLDAFFASLGGDAGRPSRLRMGFLAMLLYRIAHFLHVKGWRLPARLLWVTNICLTGADLDSGSSIGNGMIIPYPRTVTIYGHVGENCTFLGQSGIGGMLREPRGMPVVGDDVLVMPGTLILGPTIVGRGARVGPRCIITKNVPAGGEVSPLTWRVTSTVKR
jgi:serine O-acetyltransferase